jgi:phosphohistidine phosphatase
MRAYLVQHGRADFTGEDEPGGLSAEGRSEVTRMAQFLCAMRFSVSIIMHSGKARAEQTAHIFNEIMHNTAGPCATEGLAPADDPAMTANFLKVYDEDIMIAGHLPHLERLTSLLLTGSPDRRPVQFANGGVVCLEKSADGTWSLLWALRPELFRAPDVLAA